MGCWNISGLKNDISWDSLSYSFDILETFESFFLIFFFEVLDSLSTDFFNLSSLDFLDLESLGGFPSFSLLFDLLFDFLSLITNFLSNTNNSHPTINIIGLIMLDEMIIKLSPFLESLITQYYIKLFRKNMENLSFNECFNSKKKNRNEDFTIDSEHSQANWKSHGNKLPLELKIDLVNLVASQNLSLKRVLNRFYLGC